MNHLCQYGILTAPCGATQTDWVFALAVVVVAVLVAVAVWALIEWLDRGLK